MFLGSFVQDDPQAGPDSPVDPAGHGLPESPRREFQSGGLPLNEPRVAVAVEYPLAEEVVERGLPGGPLGVVVEPGSEDVLDVLGVACDGVEALLTGEERDGDGGGLVGGGGAGGLEVAGDPVVDPAAVQPEVWEAADEGPGFGAGEFSG